MLSRHIFLIYDAFSCRCDWKFDENESEKKNLECCTHSDDDDDDDKQRKFIADKLLMVTK